MKNGKLPALLNTPLWMVIMVGAVVLVTEFLFMSFLRYIETQLNISVLAMNFIDAFTVTAAVAPLLYFLVFRRMQEDVERHRQINAAALNAIVIVDGDARITGWNPAAEKMFQYSCEEAVGQPLHQLIAPQRYHDDAVRGFARFQESGGGPVVGKVTEIAALRKDGSEFPVELSISAVKLRNSWHAIGVIRDLTERKRAEKERLESGALLKDALEDAIGAIAATLEQRDPYTAGHQRRVAQLAAAIATEMGLSREVIEGIHFGGLIHDLGKISVPAEILSKPGRLTDIELELIKTHAEAGYQIVKDIAFPWPVAGMVRQHHERMDGSGYPQRLKGDEIVLEARILAVADVVEAMSADRPYRPGFGLDAALSEIMRYRGIQLDAAAVDACLHVIREKKFVFTK